MGPTSGAIGPEGIVIYEGRCEREASSRPQVWTDVSLSNTGTWPIVWNSWARRKSSDKYLVQTPWPIELMAFGLTPNKCKPWVDWIGLYEYLLSKHIDNSIAETWDSCSLESSDLRQRVDMHCLQNRWLVRITAQSLHCSVLCDQLLKGSYKKANELLTGPRTWGKSIRFLGKHALALRCHWSPNPLCEACLTSVRLERRAVCVRLP
jgi:hypothetical protein